MSMKKGYTFKVDLCSCGQQVAENWMVKHLKSNHKLPKIKRPLPAPPEEGN